MKILHLTLKKKWFDMIKSGEKTQEYREAKPYWASRLVDKDTLNYKKYDIVRFKNGYAKDAPTFDIEFLGITVGIGSAVWGADGNVQYIIKLGKIL